MISPEPGVSSKPAAILGAKRRREDSGVQEVRQPSIQQALIGASACNVVRQANSAPTKRVNNRLDMESGLKDACFVD